MGDSEEVGAGILRLLGTLKYERHVNEGDAAVCFSCCAVKLSLVELSGKKLEVFLRALLVTEEDEKEIRKRMKDAVRVCGACDKSLGTLVDINQQLEDIRLEFCDVRRRMGRQMVLGPLGKPQKSYVDWLTKVESVEHVFPSEVRKRLKKMCDVAVGTDEVVKIEEEEEFFEIFACNVETETYEGNGVDESHEIGDLGGDNAAGPSYEHLRGKNVSLESTKKSDVVAERGCKETKDSQLTKERSSVSKVRVVRPNLSQGDTVEQGRGNGTDSVAKSVEGSRESHPSALGTSTVDKTRVTSGGVSSPQTQTVGRPRRTIRKRVRYGESQSEGGRAGEEDSEFLPSVDEIVSEESEDAEIEEVGGSRRPSVACKPLTMPGCVTQQKKGTGGSNYYRRCKFCAKVCKGYPTLRRHSYVDHKEDYLKDLPFACLLCYRVFSSAKTLRDHKKKVHESLQCRDCGKFFLRKLNFIEHLRTHTGEKPYACDVCNRKFSRERDLKDHKNIHTGEKPHVCSCGENFGQRYIMKYHKTRAGH